VQSVRCASLNEISSLGWETAPCADEPGRLATLRNVEAAVHDPHAYMPEVEIRHIFRATARSAVNKRLDLAAGD
jgi:hypothetical protein